MPRFRTSPRFFKYNIDKFLAMQYFSKLLFAISYIKYRRRSRGLYLLNYLQIEIFEHRLAQLQFIVLAAAFPREMSCYLISFSFLFDLFLRDLSFLQHLALVVDFLI